MRDEKYFYMPLWSAVVLFCLMIIMTVAFVTSMAMYVELLKSFNHLQEQQWTLSYRQDFTQRESHNAHNIATRLEADYSRRYPTLARGGE